MFLDDLNSVHLHQSYALCLQLLYNLVSYPLGLCLGAHFFLNQLICRIIWDRVDNSDSPTIIYIHMYRAK